MLKVRSIAARLVISIAMIAAAAGGLVGFLAVIKEGDITRLALDREMGIQYQSVIASFEAENRTGSAVAMVLANMPPFQDAMERQDRPAMAALLAPAQKLAAGRGFGTWSVTSPPGITFYRAHNPTSFGDDVTGRRKTVAQVYASKQPVAGVEPGVGNLGIYSVSPVFRAASDGKDIIGAFDVGITFGPQFVDRIKRRFHVDLAVLQNEGGTFKTLGSSIEGNTLATPEETRQAFDGATILRRTVMAGKPVAMYLGQLKNFAGEPIAVIELVKDISSFVDSEASTRWYLIVATAIVLAAAILIALFVARSLTRPIDRLRTAMGRLSAGDTAAEIPGRNRRDELGAMADALAVFKESMIETDRLRTQQEADRQAAEGARRTLMNGLADRFEASVRGMIGAMSSSAGEMQDTARNMSVTAEETQRQSLAVSTAAEQTSTNVQTVATAAEELSASIAEIARQTAEASRVAGEVADDGRRTDKIVSGLAESVRRIGDVVGLINSIAAQTNLLALNATIEASRAGDAGKGFAVVAAEVKQLAKQTAQATGEIQSQVDAIQGDTGKAVEAIRGIFSRVEVLTNITASLSSAVEEQGAATQEIARSVGQAAEGTQDVSSTIGSVTEAANQTGAASSRVLTSAESVSANSEQLLQQADRFVAEIRAA
ncbi:methyl-accepting chemotaxis protein [Bradyrhizobium sp. dw_78]|uniref:methyl-accepting chemotaxis protein n=1 Tax=Bradyrhizobium sp. dw_78 TaxID=2719793 RepID=UPI001BD5A2A3|nr:methyl-accepting chemotaxis protein [Bradyrhizobium sp. dw_78]